MHKNFLEFFSGIAFHVAVTETYHPVLDIVLVVGGDHRAVYPPTLVVHFHLVPHVFPLVTVSIGVRSLSLEERFEGSLTFRFEQGVSHR